MGTNFFQQLEVSMTTLNLKLALISYFLPPTLGLYTIKSASVLSQRPSSSLSSRLSSLPSSNTATLHILAKITVNWV